MRVPQIIRLAHVHSGRQAPAVVPEYKSPVKTCAVAALGNDFISEGTIRGRTGKPDRDRAPIAHRRRIRPAPGHRSSIVGQSGDGIHGQEQAPGRCRLQEPAAGSAGLTIASNCRASTC